MDKITLINLYKEYPYKCPDLTKEQGRNYISKKDINCDSSYSIDLKTYKLIISTCFEYMINEYLIHGRKVILPYALGELSTVKYKLKSKPIDWKKTNENIKNGIREYAYYSLNHTEGFRWCIKWKKNKRAFQGQSFWRFKPHKSLRKVISYSLLKNPQLINKYNLR